MSENQQPSTDLSLHRLLSAVNTARVVADHEYHHSEERKQGLPSPMSVQFTFDNHRFMVRMSPMIRLTVGSVVAYLNERCELIDNETRKKVQFVEIANDRVKWHVIE
ncbi:MAG: hypothetical protein ACO3F2_11365 [Roseiflexaceae bacterium]